MASNKVLPIVLILLGVAVGFAGSVLLTSGDSSGGRASTSFSLPLSGLLAYGQGAVLTKADKSVRLASSFATKGAESTADGGFYMDVDPKVKAAVSGHTVHVKISASPSPDNPASKFMVEYVMNGLAQSPWRTFNVEETAFDYDLTYQAPQDNRSGTHVDTIWIRSDAEGRGKGLLVHAVRIVVN